MTMRLLRTCCVLLLLAGIARPAEAQLNDEVEELAGIIDVHQHVGPATQLSITRALDAIEAARIAKRHGMRAIVFKQHYLETASWAYLVSQFVPGIKLFGGIALNRSVGGLNPNAVEQVATFAGGFGRVVYFPTFESEHYNPNSPIAVPISKDGKLLPAVYEVLKVMAKYDMSMSTGHSSPQESLMLIKAAKEAGVKRIYVQHPMLERVGMTIEQQKEAAKLGALLEYVIGEALGPGKAFEHWAEGIRAVGPENVIISTDLGQRGRPLHTDGYKVVLPRLRKFGFTQAEIDTMTKKNPARFIGLEEW
jgi:microsomal dipeptidase-like Zn-dependent dipeptidase